MRDKKIVGFALFVSWILMILMVIVGDVMYVNEFWIVGFGGLPFAYVGLKLLEGRNVRSNSDN